MNTARQRAHRFTAFMSAALAALAFSLCQPPQVRAQWTTLNAQGDITNTGAGNVGIGTAPTQRLDVFGNSRMIGPAGSWTLGTAHHVFISEDGSPAGFQNKSASGGSGAHMFDNNGALRAFFQWNNAAAANGNALNFATVGADPIIFATNTNQVRMIIAGGGKVGIGVAVPTTALDVNGDINVSGNINAKYQDVAEWVPSTQKLSAGTVVILDASRDNHVLASGRAYDTKVAGVISARPGIALGEAGEGRLLVATTGRVRVKVDATHAPVQVGDLLVTSDVEGLAMKSVPVSVGGVEFHRPGTIVGKALEPLPKGKGEILVLLSMQ